MDYKRYYWLNEESRTFLSRGYIREGQSPVDRISEIAEAAHNYLPIEGYAEKFKEYMALGYYSLSTPVWINFGRDNKGLPISCYGSYVEDTLESILDVGKEIGLMSKYGGGTSVYLGDIRPMGSPISSGGFSDGAVHYARIYDTVIDTCKQAEARRGACAAYLPIDHEDASDFLNIKTEGNPIQNLQYGITVPSWWLEEMREGDVEKRKLWAKVLQRRKETGFPYIFFSDNVNDNTPYKALGRRIKASNLCSEIALPSSPDESFVCCVGSINLLHWDELVQTDAIEVYVWFLNAVMDEFIIKSENKAGLERAHKFAKNHRAIGMGVLGWHSYLQKELIPFDSMLARLKNTSIFKTLKIRSEAFSQELAAGIDSKVTFTGNSVVDNVITQTLKAANLNQVKRTCIRKGFANTTLLAVAPTKSSSFILGQVSMGIEPIKSNYFVKDLAKIKTVYKNPILEEELEKYGLNTDEVWDSIKSKDGSVQHLDFPTKDVFKTFIEISPTAIIQQAASRQKFIDQSQSLNLMIHPSTPARDINQLYLNAHDLGVKTLYYQFNINSAQDFARDILECEACGA